MNNIKINFAEKPPCSSSALFLESFKLSILAGLLTYSLFETPFPFLAEQWF